MIYVFICIHALKCMNIFVLKDFEVGGHHQGTLGVFTLGIKCWACQLWLLHSQLHRRVILFTFFPWPKSLIVPSTLQDTSIFPSFCHHFTKQIGRHFQWVPHHQAAHSFIAFLVQWRAVASPTTNPRSRVSSTSSGRRFCDMGTMASVGALPTFSVIFRFQRVGNRNIAEGSMIKIEVDIWYK